MQIEDEKGTLGTLFSPHGEIEQEVMALEGKSDDDKLNFLLKRAKLAEREDQREDDVSRDHGIRLFSRQKNQGLCRIFTTLSLLTAVYCIQLVALYNLNRASSIVDVNVVVKWLERGEWGSKNSIVNISDVRFLPDQVRTVVGGSEMNIFDMKNYGFCLTRVGGVDNFFNIGVGLIMIYLFLFFDLWFVVFDMPLTRNFIWEKHGAVMLLGTVWLVFLNSAVITWLGVISGFSVIANAGDFYSVLFTSLQLFIILVIDDTVLPAIRFLIEENNRLDQYGNLLDEHLINLTHGTAYYKPGYFHHVFRNLTGSSTINRVIAVVAIVLTLTIIVAPAVVTIVYTANTFSQC